MSKKNRPDRTSNPINEDDAALFREAIGPVKLIHSEPQASQKPKPKPQVISRNADEQAALRESQQPDWHQLAELVGDTLSYRRDEVPENVFKRLKRGEFAVQDEFDLHGMNTQQAERYLKDFLHEASTHEFSCVRIVHGKGLRSENGLPIIKALVDRLLRHHGHVLAFSSAPAAQGGSGATLVLLRRE